MPIDATPLASDLWTGIAGHFDSITQVVCEFVDNCISNFEAKKFPPRSVQITVDELADGAAVQFRIEDTGAGISDMAPVMRLGDKSIRQTPLNEHGFGLKHALASANPGNDSWAVYTRTKDDYQLGVYHKLSAPYDFNMDPKKLAIGTNSWPGLFNGSGTIVEFTCSRSFFDTIRRGMKGQPAGFQRCLDYLSEELGYIYSGNIERGQATITVSSVASGYNRTVEAVRPTWAGFYTPEPGTVRVNLGGGEVALEFRFGEMQESDYVRHYKRNQSTSGVEIRINGRLMMSNLFKDIWGLEAHPSYNHFLGTINLASEDREALPPTRTSKNGIRSGDPRLEALFEWIRKTHPNPHKDLSQAQTERELVEKLEELKNQHIRHEAKHVETEYKVFTRLGSPVSVDLYVYDGRDVVLYEAKKDTADIQNLYQLLMYWDGCVEDGNTPTEGILIASDFSPGVDPVLAFLNGRKDGRGNSYRFSKKTWRDEGVPYPR